MGVGDLILRTDGPLVLLLLGLGLYMTREVIAESLDSHCGRPLQLMALFATMLWAEGLSRALALVRRSGQAFGHDSAWLIDSYLRLGINVLPMTVALGLLVWLIAPRWSFATAASLAAILGGCGALFAWPELGHWLWLRLYLAVEALHPTLG